MKMNVAEMLINLGLGSDELDWKLRVPEPGQTRDSSQLVKMSHTVIFISIYYCLYIQIDSYNANQEII